MAEGATFSLEAGSAVPHWRMVMLFLLTLLSFRSCVSVIGIVLG